MLEPDTRELLLDLLRPPDGWSLGHALGTTFTLDLQALLVAPLSFALFDWALDDGGRANPLAMLEALRRYADRTTLFCQAGMISLPADYSPLLVHLEQAVVPVTPPNPHAIFHPKIWLLQFVRDDQQPRYRLISQSRNLTFDRSWDTVVALEGQRRLVGEHSRDLADFVASLVALNAGALEGDRRPTLEAIATDLPHVKFDPPEGFDDARFHGMGFTGASWPFPDDSERVMIISPFTGPGTLQRLAASGNGNVLASRPESLDSVGTANLGGFDKVLTLSSNVLDGTLLEDDDAGSDPTPDDDSAATAADTETRPAAAVEASPDVDRGGDGLQGLHAKVFAFQRPGRLALFTGSANATSAAFSSNVEFLVELVAHGDGATIESMLNGPDGVTVLGDLLSEYTPSEHPVEDSETEHVSSCLERARRLLGALRFRAVATATSDDPHGEYDLRLVATGPLQLPPEVSEVHCWQVTAGQGHQVKPRLRDDGFEAHLGTVSYDGLTSFFAMEVTAAIGSRRDRARFVVNTTLEGAPPHRREDVLSRLLKNRQDLLRYLMFLLGDSGPGGAKLLAEISAGKSPVTNGRTTPGLFGDAPLLETLLKALATEPDKVDQVASLMEDLEHAGRTHDLVPPDLAEIWEPIAEVREAMRERGHGDTEAGGDDE